MKTMKNNTAIIKRMTAVAAALLLGISLLSACGGNAPSNNGSAKAASQEDVTGDVVKALIAGTPEPRFSSTGGDWLIKGLSLSGEDVPEDYYEMYYDNVRAAVKSQKGVLSEDRYTEYMRAIIGLTAIGKDPYNVEGYDLTPYLDDYDVVSGQGVNAECYAIIAASACGYPLTNEDRYLEDIFVETDNEEIKSDKAYADYLSIAIEAVSLCPENENSAEFIENGLKELSDLQNSDGTYDSAEATSECIIAVVQAGADPKTDERFIKNGSSMYDGLMAFYSGNGEFRHLIDEDMTNPMAGEKALLALDALRLLGDGKALYE